MKDQRQVLSHPHQLDLKPATPPGLRHWYLRNSQRLAKLAVIAPRDEPPEFGGTDSDACSQKAHHAER